MLPPLCSLSYVASFLCWMGGILQKCLGWQYQQIEFGPTSQYMQSPTVLELECLLSRLRDAAPFSEPELLLLERTSHALASPQALSSERANLASQIWLLLSELGPIYWQHLDFILTHSCHAATRCLALTSMATRVRRDWMGMADQQQRAIKEYVVGLVERGIESWQQGGTQLQRANEVLVVLLKHEWNGLFKDFVANFASLDTYNPHKLINNFRLLQAVIAEGFASWDHTVTTAQRDAFRSSIDNDMRDILKIAVRTLRDDRPPNRQLIESCLEMLGEGLQYMPAYELFNCNLVELLLGLFHSRRFQRQLVRCFQEIFAFRERAEVGGSHLAIAKKLVQVLEVFLQRSEEADSPFDKQTVSTHDETPSQQSSHLVLNFLTRFLQRYVPSMDKTPEANDLEIEYDPKTKLKFSEELYDSLGRLFWRFWRVLGQLMEGMGSNLGYEEREEELQVLESAKLMLDMLDKLKIGLTADMGHVLQSLIVRMTPSEDEFNKFYILTDLMLEEDHARSHCRHFSQEYRSHYSRIFQNALSNPKIVGVYLQVLDKLYGEMLQKERILASSRKNKENVEPIKSKYSGWLCRRVELVNRFTWNIVIGVNINSDALAGLTLQKYISGYLKLIQQVEPVELKKCYSLNMKYLTLAYSPHFNSPQYHTLLFSPLASSVSDHIIEFLLALLSKIFTHPHFSYLLIDQNQLELMISKIKHIESMGTFDERFIDIYPAVYCLFVKMFEGNNVEVPLVSNIVKELRASLVEDQLNQLMQYARSEEEIDLPALKRSIFYFQKIQAITRYLQSAFRPKQKANRGFPSLLKTHFTFLVKCLTTYEYKHYYFSQQLQHQTRDTYESNEIILFRDNYLALATHYVTLSIIRTQQEGIDEKISVQKRNKLIAERRSIVEQCYVLFLKDFCCHRDFRCQEFINFVVEYYKWYLLTKPPQYKEIINASICVMAEQLSSESFDLVESLRSKKYVFWEQVVKSCLMILNSNTAECLVRVFQQIDGLGNNVSHSQFQAIITLMQLCFTKLAAYSDFSSDCEPPIWNYLLTIFTFTFESFFSSIFKDESLFQQLAHVFYLQTVDALRWRQQLFKNSQKGRSNNEILYIHLHNHVLKHMEMDNEQEEVHNGLLSELLKETRQGQFVDCLRDYVVFINRTANAIKLRRNQPLP